MVRFKIEFKFEENIMKKISKNIKKFRLEAGITQEQLALDIGCSIDTLYRIFVVINTRIDKFFE